MEKKTKVLLWTIVGIVAAIIVSSVILAFVAPGYLITLWAGIIAGCALGLVWKYRKELVEALNVEADCELPTPIIAEMDSFAKVEEPKEEVKEEETVAVEAEKLEPAKKAKASKKRTSKKK